MYALVHFAVAIVAYQLLIARRMVRLLFLLNILKIDATLVKPGAYSLPVFFFVRKHPSRYGISHKRLNNVNCGL